MAESKFSRRVQIVVAAICIALWCMIIAIIGLLGLLLLLDPDLRGVGLAGLFVALVLTSPLIAMIIIVWPAKAN